MPFRNTARPGVVLSSRSARHRRRRTDLTLSVLAYCCLSPVQTPPKSGCLIRDVFSGRRVVKPLCHSPLVARRPQLECLLKRFCFLEFSDEAFVGWKCSRETENPSGTRDHAQLFLGPVWGDVGVLFQRAEWFKPH